MLCNYEIHVFNSYLHTSLWTLHVFSSHTSNRARLQLLLHGSQQAFCWQITVGRTKMKCQSYSKIQCQIPCLDFREQASKVGIGRGVQCICSYSHHCSCREIFTVIPWLSKQCMQTKLTAKSLCKDIHKCMKANSKKVEFTQLLKMLF